RPPIDWKGGQFKSPEKAVTAVEAISPTLSTAISTLAHFAQGHYPSMSRCLLAIEAAAKDEATEAAARPEMTDKTDERGAGTTE
ncbi:hypothetical protein H4Q26_000022, partial [Puccinia striiformis f. sp. tritici PST-130]